jgi:hypothetical protein
VSDETSGKRVILAIYVVVVALAGFTGFALGYIGPRGLKPVSYLGLVEFQPTPFGLAAYGSLTLATVLGVMLALVMYVSKRSAES